jgi:hypothetical protein
MDQYMHTRVDHFETSYPITATVLNVAVLIIYLHMLLIALQVFFDVFFGIMMSLIEIIDYNLFIIYYFKLGLGRKGRK